MTDKCNNGPLQQLYAAATNVQQPLEPFPLFFRNDINCNQGGSFTGFNVFPQLGGKVDCPVDLSNLGTALNCMVTRQGDLDFKSSSTLSELNELPHDKTQGNILAFQQPKDDSSDTGSPFHLYSMYVPFNYKVYFFRDDPRHVALNQVRANGYLVAEPDTIYPNLTQVRLLNANLPFLSITKTTTSIKCSGNRRGVRCTVEGKAGTKETYNAPYVVICRLESMENAIVQMCTNRRQINVGNRSLNFIWEPQTQECDDFMISYCRSSKIKTSEACACFDQQERLNAKYGNELGIPVTCFGSDVTNANETPCAKNNKAYKTSKMIDNTCTVPVCEQTVKVFEGLHETAAAKGITNIKCDTTLVSIPKPREPNEKTSHTGPINNSNSPQEIHEAKIETISRSVPSWPWYLVAGGILVFIIFLFVFARATKVTQVTQGTEDYQDDQDDRDVGTTLDTYDS